MCQICKRVSETSLQATIVVALIKAGMAPDAALSASTDVLTEFAKSEVSHPKWAAKILGLHQGDADDEQKGEQEDGTEGVEIAPGVMVHIHRMHGDTGDSEKVSADELPPEVSAMIKKFASALAGVKSKD